MELDIAPGRGLAADLELVREGEHLFQVGRVGQVSAEKLTRGQELDCKSVRLGFLPAMSVEVIAVAGHEVALRAPEPDRGCRPVVRVEKVPELVSDRAPPPARGRMGIDQDHAMPPFGHGDEGAFEVREPLAADGDDVEGERDLVTGTGPAIGSTWARTAAASRVGFAPASIAMRSSRGRVTGRAGS